VFESLPPHGLGSSVHGISQVRIVEWVQFHSPEDLPNPGIEPGSPALKVDSLPSELLGNKIYILKIYSETLRSY